MSEQEVDTRKKLKRGLLIAILVIASLLAVSFASTLRKFSGYDLEKSIDQTSASSFSYISFRGNTVRYGKDGAACTDAKGNVLWNQSFEMQDPKADVCQTYLIVYDREGTEIDLISEDGRVKKITTSYPITRAAVSAKGSVSALMQDGSTAHIEVYQSSGSKAANGEIHMNKGGYPLSIAVSPDGNRLMVSMVSIIKGKVGSKIQFYDFGSSGKNKVDNIVGTFRYEGSIFPEIGFSENGKAAAMGTDKIVLYSSGSSPKESKVIKPKGNMKSVFMNDRSFGYIAEEKYTKDKKETVKDTIEMYSFSGLHRYSKAVPISYEKACLSDYNELILRSSSRVCILSSFGSVRFNHEFSETIYDFITGKSRRSFELISEDKIESIRLH